MLDVDGVLVGGRPDDGRNHFADLGVSVERLQAEFFLTPLWEEVIVGRAELASQLSLVLAHIAPHLDAETLIAYWLQHDARVHQSVLEGVRKIRARGIRVLLTTNQEHRRARYLMEDMRIGEDVDGIVYSAALGFRKPAPEFFALAAERAGAAAAELTLVDDHLPNVEAARRAGWQAVHWSGGKQRLEDELAPFLP